MKILVVVVFMLALVLLYFVLNQRIHCPNPDDVWVMSEGRWVCVRPTYVP